MLRMHLSKSCELYGLYDRKLYGLYVDYTDYMHYTFEKNWTIFHIIHITWVHKLYGRYIDYTDYTYNRYNQYKQYIKITCLYLQSCQSTRRSANMTHMLLLYKILHCRISRTTWWWNTKSSCATTFKQTTCWCTRASALMPFQVVSQTVKIALWWLPDVICKLLGTGMVS